MSDIRSIFQAIYISDERITDTEIPEIYLIHFAHFTTEFSTESTDSINDKSLLQQIDISDDGISVYAECIGELMYRDFTPYLKCEELEEFCEFFGILYLLEEKYIFVEVIASEFEERFSLFNGIFFRKNIRIAPID